MAIVYRTGNNGLDRPLTWEEVDSNFAELDLRVTDLENLSDTSPILQVQGSTLVLAMPGGGTANVDLSPLVAGVDNDTTVSNLAFDKSSGILTLTETDGSNIGVDLDGRYVQIGQESKQTLGISGQDLILYDNDGTTIADTVSLSGLVGSALTYNDIQISTETPGPVSKIEKVAVVAGDSFRIEYTPADLTPYMLKNTLTEATDITFDYVTTNGASTTNDVTVGHLVLSNNVSKRDITGPAIIEINPVGTNNVSTTLAAPEADGTVVLRGNLLVEGSKTTFNSDDVNINGGSITFYNSRSVDPGINDDAVITVNRGDVWRDAKLFWDEQQNNWRLTTPDDSSTLSTSSDRIITDADHYVTSVTGEDGIEIDNSGIATDGTSVHTTDNASSLTIGLGQESIANDRLVNSTISLGDGTSTFDEVALGETLNIVGDTDLTVTVTDNTFTIDHNNVGPVGGREIGNASTPPVNEFVDYVDVSETGHILDIASSPIDWDVDGNFGFRYVTGDNTGNTSDSLISNYIEAATNTDEFRIAGGDDIETVINSGLDTVTVNNISTLDTVTTRGAITTNDVTVGNLTADDIYTTTGNIYSPGNIRIDPQGDSTADSTNGDGEVTINGNLEVLGDTVHIHSEHVLIGDNKITLNHHGALRDAGIVIEREADGTSSDDDVSLYWDETADQWKITEYVDSAYIDNRIITENDHYIKNIVGEHGIVVDVTTFDGEGSTASVPLMRPNYLGQATQVVDYNDWYPTDDSTDLIYDSTSTDDAGTLVFDDDGNLTNASSNASTVRIGLGARSVANSRLVNDRIYFTDDNGYKGSVSLGEFINFGQSEDIFVVLNPPNTVINEDVIRNNDGIPSNNSHLTTTPGAVGGVTMVHAKPVSDSTTDSVVNPDQDANKFVNYVEYSNTGHIVDIQTTEIDFNVPANYNFTKYTDAHGNVIVPDSNDDTVEFRVSDDTLYDDLEIRVANTADGDSSFDSTSSDSTLVNDDFVVFKNTSTLQSVTDRGAVTDNDLEVNASITMTGELRGPSTFIIDPRYDIDTLDSTDSSYDSTYDSTYGNAGGVVKILGELDVDGLVFPTVDGTENQIVMTDGAGQLRLDTPNTTHVVEDPDATTESGTMYYTDTRVDNYLRSGEVEEIRFGKPLDSNGTSTEDVAIITWNENEGTLDVDLPQEDVTLQLGQESYYRVHSQTTAIPNGTVVTFSGSLDTHSYLNVDIADHDASDFAPERVIGVVTSDITGGMHEAGHGFATSFGKVRDINTSAFEVGDALYLDPNNPGQFTNIQPVTPNLSVLIGFVLVKDATEGVMFVRLNYSFTTDQLPEGNINLYFTNERVNQALEVVNTESYDPLDSTYDSENEYLGSLTIDYDLDADSTDMTTFTYTGPHIDEIRALVEAGLGVTYDNTTGEISIGQAVEVDSNVLFNQVTAEDGVFESLHPLSSTSVLTVEGDMTVTGDFIVEGTVTTINTEEVNIADNFVLLNSDYAGDPATTGQLAGIEIERGSGDNVQLRWNETGNRATGRWQIQQNGNTAGFTFYDILTTDDTIIDDVDGIDGIEILHSSSDNSIDIGIHDRGIENIKLANDRITFTDGNSDSSDNIDVVLGTEVVIQGDDDIEVDLNAGVINVLHQTPSFDSTGDTIVAEVKNEFIDYVAYNDTGHITAVEKSEIDWDVAENWAFKTITTDSGSVIADRNDDTLEITGGNDISVIVTPASDSANDSITVNNTSDLDSVTSRGAETTNEIKVGGLTIDHAFDSTNAGITFEGDTSDGFETFVGAVNPTSDRNIVFPDSSGTVALEGQLNSILDDLENVETGVKADGQALVWNDSSDVWEPGDVLTLDEISADVDSTVVSGQPANLEYDNTSGLFTLTLGDYVMTTGDTMSGDLTLDNANLVFDKTAYTVTLAAGPSAASTDIDLILPDESGTLATLDDVNLSVGSIRVDVNESVTSDTGTATIVNDGSGNLTFNNHDMTNYIRYDTAGANNVTGHLAFNNNIQLQFGTLSADMSIEHDGTSGQINTDTDLEVTLTEDNTYFAVQKSNTANNIIKALDVTVGSDGSGEVILGADGYNTVLTFANTTGSVTIDAADQVDGDVTITIPDHSARNDDSSYHAQQFMLTSSLLEELHDVDISGRVEGSFPIWRTSLNRWVMNDSESGFIPLAGTALGGKVEGEVEFNGGHIYINDSDDLGATNSIVFGTGSDAAIYHDSTNTIFNNQTGELQIESDTLRLTSASSGGETYLLAVKDAGVELYYDDTKKIETDANGVTVIGNVNLSEDNANITIGGSNELIVTQSPTVGSITSTGSDAFTIQSSNSDLILQGNTKVNVTSNLTSSGAVTFTSGTDNTLGSLNGAVVITGGASVGENFTVIGGLHVDKEVVLDSETSSTTPTTGALQVHGGVGIGENLNVAHDVVLGTTATDTVTFNSDIESNFIPETDGTYDLGTNSQRWKTIYVDQIMSGTSTGTGSGLTMGNVTIGVDGLQEISTRTGNLIIDSADDGGTTTLDDNVIVTGTLHVDGQSTLASVNVEDLTEYRIVLAGSSGELRDDINFTFNGNTFDIGQGQFTVDRPTGDIYTAGDFSMDGVFAITNTTESNEPADGALRVAGGAGIAKNLNVGGTATVDQHIVVDNTTSSLGRLELHGNLVHSISPGSNMFTIKSGTGSTGSDNITIDAKDTFITGNLTVQGTTTTINTEEVTIEDNLILLNSNQTGTPATTLTSGIEVERGDASNVKFIWDEQEDYWTIEGYNTNAGHENKQTFYAERLLGTEIGGDVFGKTNSGLSTTLSNLPILTVGDNTGTTAYARIDIYDNNNTAHILQNGGGYNDAWFKGDIQQADADGGTILDNLYTGRIGDQTEGVDVTDKPVYYGYVDGDIIGDIYSENGFKVFDNGTTTDNEDNTRARFWGDHIGDVYSQDGVNKVLETSNDSTGGSYLDVEQVYANIYAEDRTKLILDTGDANGAGATINADVVAFDETVVLDNGSNGGDAWFRGDVKSKTDGTTLVLDTTDNAAKLKANVYARDGDTGESSGMSYFEGVQVDGSLHVDGDITTDGLKLILGHFDQSADSTADGDIDNAGIVIGTGTYAPSFLYDAEGNQWVSNVPIQGQIAGGASTAAGLDHDVTFSLTGDVIGSVVSDLSGAAVSIATTVGDDSHNHTTAFITDFDPDVRDVVDSYIREGTHDAIVVTLGEANDTLTIAHADTSNIGAVSTPTTPTLGFETFHVITGLDMTFDTYGHVQTTTPTYTNLDDRYFTETEATDLFVNHAGDTMTGNLLFNDSVDIVMDSALTIGHDTASYITSTTPLTVTTDTFNLVSNTGSDEMMITATQGGAVNLYHNDVLRLATSANGIDVTGDFDISAGATVGGTLAVTNNATVGSLNVDSLVQTDGIVLVGTNGRLETDDNFLYDGLTFTMNTNKFTIDVGTGNTAIAGTLAVNTSATIATLKVSDLTDNRIVISGSSGELEDDSNFTFDGTTFKVGTDTTDKFTVDVSTGNTAIAGTLDVTGVMNFTDVVNFNSTTESTGITDGSIVVDGGAGIAKDVYIGQEIDVDGEAYFHENVSLDNEKELRLGAGDDFKIAHSGTNATITNTTGDLTITGASGSTQNMYFKAGSKSLIDAIQDGAVILYNNEVARLSTTDGGVEVEGNVNIDGSVSGGDIEFAHTASIKTTLTADQGAADTTATIPAITGIMTMLTDVDTNVPTSNAVDGTKGEIRTDGADVYICVKGSATAGNWIKLTGNNSF